MDIKLIIGIGNYGNEYKNTRHNIGFTIIDFLAEDKQIYFKKNKYGYSCSFTNDDCKFILLKPTTFVNNSGLAVKHWMTSYSIPIENILVLVDDLNLQFGELRFKKKGSHGGHNGLKNIEEKIGANYPRLRFGIGNDFKYGKQSDFVLSKFTKEEMNHILASKHDIINKVKEIIGC